MGYSIEDLVYESGFILRFKKFFDKGGYDPEDKNDAEFFSEFFLKELVKFFYMEAPDDSDHHFDKYKIKFLKSIFKAITGGRLDVISFGDRLSQVLSFYFSDHEECEQWSIRLQYSTYNDQTIIYEFDSESLS